MSDFNWTVDYAIGLLRGCGYEPKRFHLQLEIFHRNIRTVIEIDSGRVKSSDVQPLLDKPLMLGSMRVRQ